MPTYGPLGTTVGLYCWDPAPGDCCSTTADASAGYRVERISEERFDTRRGVDFLGSSSYPFYLMNAGQDLLYGSGVGNAAHGSHRPNHDGKNPSPIDAEPIVSLEKRETPQGKDASSPKTPNKGVNSDLDSVLSSISSSRFSGSTPGEEGPRKKATPKNTRRALGRRRFALPNLVDNAIQKPIHSPIPIKLQIDFTRKSFFRSLVTNEAQDVCVNVFVNGEFVHSKMFRARTLLNTRDDAHPTVAGRRVESYFEVPWIVLPMHIGSLIHGVAGKEVTGNSSPSGSGAAPDKPLRSYPPSLERSDNLTGNKMKGNLKALFAGMDGPAPKEPPQPLAPITSKAKARWDEINQNILTEAGAWGKEDGSDMHRTPVGEYLEELSKLPFPANSTMADSNDPNIGILDVVISLGRAGNVTEFSYVPEPRRNLSEAFCGPKKRLFTVPKEPKPKALKRMTDECQAEEEAKLHVRGKGIVDPPKNPKAAVTESRDGLSLDTMTTPASVISTTQAVPLEPRSKEHPEKRKNVPQKTYKGPSPSSTKPGPAEEAEWPSRSTRSRVSAGSPLVPDPQSSQDAVGSVRKSNRQQTRSLRAAETPTPGSRTKPFSLDGSTDEKDEWRRDNTRFSGYLYTTFRRLAPSASGISTRNEATSYGYDGAGASGKLSKRKRRPSEVPNNAPKAKVARMDTEEDGIDPASHSELSMALNTDTESKGKIDSILPTIEKPECLPVGPTLKKARPQMSHRELSALLSPHKSSKVVDSSFGHSFDEKGSGRRPLRNAVAKQKHQAEVVRSPNLRRVTAKVEDRMLMVEGLRKEELFRFGSDEMAKIPLSKRVSSGDVLGAESVAVKKADSVLPRPFEENSFVDTFLSDAEPLRSRLVGQNRKENYASTQASRQSNDFLKDPQKSRVLNSMNNLTKVLEPLDHALEARLALEPHTNAVAFNSKNGAKPRTSSVTKTRSRPNLSIQTGLSNTQEARTFNITDRGLKTPTPKSGTFSPTALRPPPSAYTRSSMVSPSAIVMAPLVASTPSGEDNPSKSSRRLLAATASSPIEAPPASPSATRRLRALPPRKPVTGPPGAKPTPASIVRIPKLSETPDHASISNVASGESCSDQVVSTASASSNSARSRTTPSRIKAQPNTQDSSSLTTFQGPSQVKAVANSETYLGSAESKVQGKATSNTKITEVHNTKEEPKIGWRPTVLCRDSVLTYVGDEETAGLLGLEYKKTLDNFCRKTGSDRETVFRASGILMGVRYVFGLQSTRNK